jgi:hypothetical protein
MGATKVSDHGFPGEIGHGWRAFDWLTVHLLLVEKEGVSDAFHQGVLSRPVQEKLVGDVDARLLRLESGQADEPVGPATGPDAPNGAGVIHENR